MNCLLNSFKQDQIYDLPVTACGNVIHLSITNSFNNIITDLYYSHTNSLRQEKSRKWPWHIIYVSDSDSATVVSVSQVCTVAMLILSIANV